MNAVQSINKTQQVNNFAEPVVKEKKRDNHSKGEVNDYVLPGAVCNHSFESISLYPKKSIQPKLSINQPNDVYEQEADAMADKVMRMPEKAVAQRSYLPGFMPLPAIQRKCAECEKEEEKTIQRKCAKCEEEEEKAIQRKCAKCEEEEKLQRKESGNAMPAAGQSVHQTLKSPGQPLDDATRLFMEQRFGFDFGNVRIHNNSLAHQSAKDINAFAYTYGNNIVFGNSQYKPQTNKGKRLLAHELTHVVQQSGGQHSIQRAGPINCDPANIEVFNDYMHRKWCDKPRSCSFQGDSCASATAKVAAGYGCVDARTVLQQKCFNPGDPGYETHMQQIAEASAALRNCIAVMRARCAAEIGLAAAAATVAVTLGKAAKGALGKVAGKAFIYAEAGAAIILLMSGKAEAKISLSGDSALESLYKAMEQNGTPVPDDLKKLIESDPELQKLVEESAKKGGKLSDVQKEILKKYTDYISKHMDEFSHDELEQLLSSTDSISTTASDPSLDAIKKSLKQKADKKAKDGQADAGAKPADDQKPSTPSKDADAGKGIGIESKDQPSEKPSTADLKKKFPKLSDAVLKQVQDASAPVRFLLQAYLTKNPDGFEITDALIGKFFSLVPATLTQEQAEKVAGNLQLKPGATEDEIFEGLKEGITKVTQQEGDTGADSGETAPAAPGDPKKDAAPATPTIGVSKDDAKKKPSKSDKETAEIWEKFLVKIDGLPAGDMHIIPSKAPYKIGAKNQEAFYGSDSNGVVYVGVITFIVLEMHGDEWKVKILAGASLYTHGRKYGSTKESTTVFYYTAGKVSKDDKK